MDESVIRVNRERVIAFLLALAGVYVLLISLKSGQGLHIPLHEFLLAFLFAGSMIFADRYPIHLLRGTKLSLVNLPIFLCTVLLSAPLAIAATGIGLLTANILGRVERGLLLRDIASTVGQWMGTVYLGYQIVHWDGIGLPLTLTRLGLLALCALSFLLIDFIVFSIAQSSIYGEPFLPILKAVVKEGFVLEVVQYVIAIPGVLAIDQDPWSLVLFVVPISITYSAFKNIKETRLETLQVLNEMADTVDLRDTSTGGHSKHVAELVRQTLAQLKVAGPEATLIEIAARLHDLGKIGIPDCILLKPGKLTPEEMAVMQTHAQKGAELISKYKDFARGAELILHHHERWDGQGYPSGLRGPEVPFGARVIAVADSFEAMTSDRPYRQALSVDQALQILLAGRGKQWDPNIVNAFVDLVMINLSEKSSGGISSLQAASPAPQPSLRSSPRSLGIES
jgi:HD-GYP domain-containing protein (c-di-GMP phosphodiesterase class II)